MLKSSGGAGSESLPPGGARLRFPSEVRGSLTRLLRFYEVHFQSWMFQNGPVVPGLLIMPLMPDL
jgi:hypothetical protein